ncbi:MAG: DUF4292 domain-containing protein [Bacteroidales bacterium]|nr:DUF4292 domain-containing protein [Bacteroidales bacterium]
MIGQKVKYSLLIIGIIATMWSCKVAFVGGGRGENLRPPKLYKEIIENRFEFDNLTLKFSADMYVGEEKQEFSGIMRMQKDTAIWISLRSFNIEGVRVLITKDSVKFINRLEKTFYEGNFNFLTNRFEMDMDYNMIEAVFTNSFFFYPQPEDSSKAISNFKQCYDSTLYCMSSISERKYSRYYIEEKNQGRWERKLEKEINDTVRADVVGYETNEFVFQFVKVLPDLYRVHDMYLENYIQQQSLYIEYGKQYLVENQYFPHEISVEIITPRFVANLKINIESVTIDSESMSFPFKISDKYERIEL